VLEGAHAARIRLHDHIGCLAVMGDVI
jgi:hypothetical protein